jgi:hypothetical protein
MNIKHLEKSKCFFRAQKGVNHVYLGVGVDCPGVVGIPTTGIFYLFVYERIKQRAQEKKVGDPSS